MTLFNDGTDDYEPVIVEGFDSASQTLSIVRKSPFSGAVSVVLRHSPPGAGHLRALWTTSAEAKAMKIALDAGVLWTFSDADHATLDMSFVVDGSAAIETDPRSPAVWWTVFDYQEVTP